jgi:hypothetical protein
MTELIGSWRKVGAPECAAGYPVELAFSTSTYRGTRGDSQGFVQWDAGVYRIDDDGRLVLSLATDELVAYEFQVTGELLEIVDSVGCRFSYRRVPPPI